MLLRYTALHERTTYKQLLFTIPLANASAGSNTYSRERERVRESTNYSSVRTPAPFFFLSALNAGPLSAAASPTLQGRAEGTHELRVLAIQITGQKSETQSSSDADWEL
jgi:hypothetical protein